jgi:hypothetical protein
MIEKQTAEERAVVTAKAHCTSPNAGHDVHKRKDL